MNSKTMQIVKFSRILDQFYKEVTIKKMGNASWTYSRVKLPGNDKEKGPQGSSFLTARLYPSHNPALTNNNNNSNSLCVTDIEVR